MSDKTQEPLMYSKVLTLEEIDTLQRNPSVIAVLTRIADALDRAYPPPAEKAPGKLKPGVAEYKYEDPQTEELRILRDVPKETPSH